MSRSGMNRRQFLQTTAVTTAGAAAAAGTGTILVDPKGAWAMSLQMLDEHTATTLVKVARELYPHDRLGDVYYAKVVESLDGKAVKDKDVGKLLADGVAALDQTEGAVKWVDLSPGYRLASLKAMEGTPFFQTVRSECITGIYNNPDVWRHFGYEGPSFEFGGYIERGFNDLGWLENT
ncbi:MAG TPA: twin-arginine translocation signal domain-containing protein [Candidatus Acidoferrum sp.]|nr:twin-arginine translocation signal domain-containing protein [Candidatus Acidoferrum sp.]